MMNTSKWILAAGLASGTLAANAQSQVTVFGLIDQYVNVMRSSSGTKVKALEDGGGIFNSRFGVRGTEDLGGGYSAKFWLESGLSADNGTQSDSTRFWNRQSWVGLAAPYGELRLGRQITPIYARGCYIDYGCRGSGSMVNSFGLPVRFDNAISALFPRTYGVKVEALVAAPESPLGNRPIVYAVGADWTNDTFVFGYAGARARTPSNALIKKDMVYDNLFANWMYGKGTVYLVYVRSNNNTASGGINNAGTIVGNSGGINAGTNPDLRNFYKIYQVSADYRVLDNLRVGAAWGTIKDQSGRQRGATDGSIGAYYDLSKRTTLFTSVETLHNEKNGGWRPAASGAIKTTFTAASDVNGQKIDRVLAGISHRF